MYIMLSWSNCLMMARSTLICQNMFQICYVFNKVLTYNLYFFALLDTVILIYHCMPQRPPRQHPLWLDLPWQGPVVRWQRCVKVIRLCCWRSVFFFGEDGQSFWVCSVLWLAQILVFTLLMQLFLLLWSYSVNAVKVDNILNNSWHCWL
jgi:hypothetical protein